MSTRFGGRANVHRTNEPAFYIRRGDGAWLTRCEPVEGGYMIEWSGEISVIIARPMIFIGTEAVENAERVLRNVFDIHRVRLPRPS